MKKDIPIFWWGLLLLWPLLGYWNQWLVTPSGSIAIWAALGAVIAVCLWHYNSRHGLPCRAVLLVLVILWILGRFCLAALDSAASLSLALGSDRWIQLRLSLEAGLWAFCLVLGLRTLSWRFASAITLELAMAGSIFVIALQAHRDGYINRPFQLVDPLWLRGLDPAVLFATVGSLALVAISILALNRPNNRRPWWDLPLMLFLLIGLYLYLPADQIKQTLQSFGLGGQAGDQRSPSPEGGFKTPAPDSNQGISSNSGDPSFADSRRNKSLPVAVVIFRDDYEPISGAYFFRQSSGSQFNGIKLVGSQDDRFDRDNAQSFPTQLAGTNSPAEGLAMRLPRLAPAFFRPLKTRVALLHQHPRPFGLSNPEHYWAITNPDPGRFQKAYEVESQVLQGSYLGLVPKAAGDLNWSAEEWSHYLQGPTDGRYKELADSIISQLPEARRDSTLIKAVAIKRWLDENCTYSLTSPSTNASDPVSDYLFGQRIGYCVFTSHSACYLFRAAGIPARISNGYMVAAAQRGNSSSLLIRSGDAHSWPEIYLQDIGWLELDIAPEKNLEPEGEQVDSDLQQMMGDMARKDHNQPRPEDNRPALDLHGLLLTLLQYLALGVMGLLGLGCLVMLLWKVWRRRAPFLCNTSDQARLAYICVLDILSQQGVRRVADESCEAFARRLAAEVPALLPLVCLHLRVRLGPPGTALEREVIPLLKACLTQVQSRKVVGWRKYLGWLDPSSPLKVR